MFTTSYYYQLLSYLITEITYTSLTDEIDVYYQLLLPVIIVCN